VLKTSSAARASSAEREEREGRMINGGQRAGGDADEEHSDNEN
jgi:hypothetical protein